LHWNIQGGFEPISIFFNVKENGDFCPEISSIPPHLSEMSWENMFTAKSKIAKKVKSVS
jgi:hypothetical protein